MHFCICPWWGNWWGGARLRAVFTNTTLYAAFTRTSSPPHLRIYKYFLQDTANCSSQLSNDLIILIHLIVSRFNLIILPIINMQQRCQQCDPTMIYFHVTTAFSTLTENGKQPQTSRACQSVFSSLHIHHLFQCDQDTKPAHLLRWFMYLGHNHYVWEAFALAQMHSKPCCNVMLSWCLHTLIISWTPELDWNLKPAWLLFDQVKIQEV